MTKFSAPAVSTATVRAHFRKNEKAMARLSERSQASVREGARGQVTAEVVAVYNKGRKPANRYAVGNTNVVKAAQGEHAQALRASVAQAGVPVGKRGPLSKAARQALRKG